MKLADANHVRKRILVIDDFRAFHVNADITYARTCEEGLRQLERGGWDCVYLDHDLDALNTIRPCIEWIEEHKPDCEFLIVTQNPYGRFYIQGAFAAMARRGYNPKVVVWDTFVPPCEVEQRWGGSHPNTVADRHHLERRCGTVSTANSQEEQMNQVELARLIATIAHGATGQTRADGITPYILHPERVAHLAGTWAPVGSSTACISAGYLHDVLEDTKLTRDDLISYGVPFDVLDIVERLTKPDNGPAPESYYQGISESDDAVIVKCADRCANLEDALREVESTRSLKRWRRYVEKTRTDVLPMYVTLPMLRNELLNRLHAIEVALERAECRKVAHDDERQRAFEERNGGPFIARTRCVS